MPEKRILFLGQQGGEAHRLSSAALHRYVNLGFVSFDRDDDPDFVSETVRQTDPGAIVMDSVLGVQLPALEFVGTLRKPGKKVFHGIILVVPIRWATGHVPSLEDSLFQSFLAAHQTSPPERTWLDYY